MVNYSLCLLLLNWQPDHQQLIVDAGALPHLVALLKRNKNGVSRSVHGVIRRAADAITNLAHENSSIKSCVRSVDFLYFPCAPSLDVFSTSDTKQQNNSGLKEAFLHLLNC